MLITILKWIGFPMIFGGLCYVVKLVKSYRDDVRIFKSAVQSMMRAQLIKDGKQYLKDGCIETLEYLDWQKRYNDYHNLGQNGVLDELNNKIISLAASC